LIIESKLKNYIDDAEAMIEVTIKVEKATLEEFKDFLLETDLPPNTKTY